jgi:recA bacterial DNA recombination protein
MSSLPCSWNAGESLSSTYLPAGPTDKKTIVLNHLASSKRLIDVRPASRLEVRPRPEMLSTGIPEVDAITGGIPRGCLSEICGPASSGKTSVLLAAIAAATQRDETCVLIDASDSFDPESGAAAGVDFRKLLWVRCGDSPLCNSVSSVVKDFDQREHPSTSLKAGSVTPGIHRKTKASERRLEQVLKTTDLVLQSGGFGLIALDLAGIPEKFVRRIPLASWFRFQRAVEHTKTALLVVSEFACAQTCAAVVLKLGSQPLAISSQPSGKPSHTQLLQQIEVEAEVGRMRMERKPAASVRTVFVTRAVRAG